MTTIPGPLFREFVSQVGAEFLEALEQAILADELTDEEVQHLRDISSGDHANA